MTLPSQFRGGGGRRGIVTARRRRRRGGLPRIILGVSLLGLLGASAWLIWPSPASGSDDRDAAGDSSGTPGGSARLAFLGEDRASSSTDDDRAGGADRQASASSRERVGREPDAAGSGTERRVSRPSASQEPLVIDQGRAHVDGRPLGANRDPEPTGERVGGDALASPRPEAASVWTVPAHASDRVRGALETAEQHAKEGRLARAREVLNEAMFAGGSEDERRVLRARIAGLNERLLFSPDVYADDPMAELYRVQPGDVLARIVREQDLSVGWRLIQRVNRLPSPDRIRVGQQLKVVRGPFHAVVDKSDFRLDVFWGPADQPEQWTYVRSFPVGLGEGGSTPVGRFRVRANSRLKDPAWTNPRTGEKHQPGDDNPIGRFWIGMAGEDEFASLTGYGIHGTNEPASIGEERSMGCIRLDDDDITLLFSMLVERASAIRVVP